MQSLAHRCPSIICLSSSAQPTLPRAALYFKEPSNGHTPTLPRSAFQWGRALWHGSAWLTACKSKVTFLCSGLCMLKKNTAGAFLEVRRFSPRVHFSVSGFALQHGCFSVSVSETVHVVVCVHVSFSGAPFDFACCSTAAWSPSYGQERTIQRHGALFSAGLYVFKHILNVYKLSTDEQKRFLCHIEFL